MDHVAVDDLAPDAVAGAERWPLGEALGAAGLAVNRYRLPPGEGFPGGLHAHADQEEVFLVLAGTVTFERYDPSTEPPTAGTVTVAAGEAVRFPPGEFQHGENPGSEPCVALAIGAPAESAEVRVPLSCPDCGKAGLGLSTDGDLAFDCPACGSRHDPAPCPECGGTDLGATLADGRPVAECADCGARFREPPVEE